MTTTDAGEVPDTGLQRMRRFVLGAGLMGFTLLIPAILGAPYSGQRRLVGVAALLSLMAIAVVTYRRSRPLPLDALLVPVLMVVAGVNLVDAMASLAICMNVLFVMSLYGSRLRAVVLATLAVGAVMATLWLTPYLSGDVIQWLQPHALANLPQLAVIAVLTRILLTTLRAHFRASQREALLARTGSRLLAAASMPELWRLSREAGEELCSLTRGTAALVVELDGDTVRVLSSAGDVVAPDELHLPASLLTRDGTCGEAAFLPLAEPVEALRTAAPHLRHWYVLRVDGPASRRYVLIGGRRPVHLAVLNAHRTLADQCSLAHASRAAYERLDHKASHDELTGLPTRGLFLEQVGAAIETAREGVTLLNIDLDDFKQVNDVHGHAAGDELLVEAARRMREVCGAASVPARFGGDEFAVLLPTSLGGEDAAELARALCRRLTDPMVLSAATVTVGASIGVASWSAPLTAGDVLRCADIAMYWAKAMGKNRVEHFDPARHGDIARHRLLEDHLASAVERGEIVVRYEPSIDVVTGECVAVEAEPHWEHPLLGLLAPAEFLPQARRSGRVNEIGAHVLATACAELAAWSGVPALERTRLCVDVTARQLTDPAFSGRVLGALADAGLPPQRLTLELTDADDTDERSAHPQLAALAELGVRICVDGFATGRDTLTVRNAFPVHELKIDGAATLASPTDAVRSLQVVRAIGDVLGLQLTAHGVGDGEQVAHLRENGVTAVQGPAVAGALSAPQLASWVAEHGRAGASSR
ncbi:diguanylate cyclase (GGDEF)-like protein [Kineococcus xinjiangensis]|uniref:Diguanylate cyclase (GGDEF)-like protein n=1 Tax=Kineococcus xinjiangensis TaxID=512762 RepID=A0A2S6IT64_9ACTN|nr:EAL domain-containing protein [Kineococcus xinjiangensis]PPK97370.1 diguanylate cyclase (GGDEF)-like protein [Kineococcus xinjiangensis]